MRCEVREKIGCKVVVPTNQISVNEVQNVDGILTEMKCLGVKH